MVIKRESGSESKGILKKRKKDQDKLRKQTIKNALMINSDIIADTAGYLEEEKEEDVTGIGKFNQDDEASQFHTMNLLSQL